MKKHCIGSLLLLLSLGSFGFWELEGPYGEYMGIPDKKNVEIREYSYPSAHVEAFPKGYYQYGIEKRIYCKYNYLYMYNRQTGYSIAYIDSQEDLGQDAVIDFFLGKSAEYSWKRINSYRQLNDFKEFWFIKENSGLDLSDSGGLLFGRQLCLEALIDKHNKNIPSQFPPNPYHINTKDLMKNPIDIPGAKKSWQKIDSIGNSNLSLTKLSSKGKVEIKQSKGSLLADKSSESLDFQKQLEKYFDKDGKNAEFAENLKNSLLTDGDLSKKQFDADKMHALKIASRVGEGEIKRLKNSNILAVYNVMRNDKLQYAIIWGLAEDKESHRTFHWITDLEDDFSILLNQ